MFSDTEGYKNAPSWEPLLLYYGSIMPFNKFSSQNFRNASSFLNQIFVLTNWWTVLKTKYSWPLNNMGLNYMGPLIHGYFSTVRNTVLYGTSGYRGPALKLCLDESPHCSRVNSVVLQSLWEKTRRFCKTFCNGTVWYVSHQSVSSLQSPAWTSARNPAACVLEASQGACWAGGIVENTELDLFLLDSL